MVLDRSGSMEYIRDETIGSVNGYVDEVKADHPNARFSLTIFDNVSIDTIVDNVAISDVKPLTRETYVPRGMTPLHDAIGHTVALLEKSDAKNKILVVLTDGFENCSREFNGMSIKKLLDSKQTDDSWLVIYLGANQDACVVGQQMGFTMDNSLSFAADKIGLSMTAVAGATTRYMKGGKADAAFTAEERTDAS
jgi:hypothetical protein